MDVITRLNQHRFQMIFLIILLLNIPIALFRVYPIFSKIYQDEDGWLGIAGVLYARLFNPAYTLPSSLGQAVQYLNAPLNAFYHDKTPLYPFLIALLTIIFKDIYVSAVYMAIITNVLILVVVRKIAMEFLHLANNDVFKLLSIFASTYLAAHYFTVPVIFSLYGLLGTLNVYLNLSYFRKPSFKGMLFLCISNTLTMFCHEDIWLMIFMPELFLILLYLLKGKITYLKGYNFGLNFVMLSFFTSVIPVLGYATFFVSLDMWPTLVVTWSNLSFYRTIFFPNEFPLEFLVSFFYTITYLWIFVFQAMWRDYRLLRQQFKTNFIVMQERLSLQQLETENPGIKQGGSSFSERLASFTRDQNSSNDAFFDKFLVKMMLYFWLCYYLIYKIAFPGPFYPHFYFPILFALSILIFEGISNRKSSENLFWFVIIVNSILNLTQILLMAPWFYMASQLVNNPW